MSLGWHSKSGRRRRNPQACSTCRERRTKCDGQRPKCSFCTERGKDCFYLGLPDLPPTPLDLEVSMIWERLDQITSALGNSSPPQHHSPEEQTWSSDSSDESPPLKGFPYMILQNESFMGLLGLKLSFSRHIEQMERSRDVPPVHLSRAPVVIGHDRALSLLNTFGKYVHIWYPVLHPSFTIEFVHSITHAFPPSSESCLTLLVLAIGSVVEDISVVDLGEYPQGHSYVEAAMERLPLILATGDSVRSTQCLLLLSIYFLCCVQPCSAHEFVSMASIELQNELQNDRDGLDERSSIIGNCYWASLLIESEILVQLDLGNSGIWDLSPIAPAPISCESWTLPLHLSPILDSTMHIDDTSDSDILTSGLPEADLSYLIAEIAMRKMLQRCTWSVSELSPGCFGFGHIVATELERQLDEWRMFLPEKYEFQEKTREASSTSDAASSQTEFLRTQYYAFKASVYWPAVYQILDTGVIHDSLLLKCHQFCEAYAAFITSAAGAVQVCRPNRWTLCTSVFTISMAAIMASSIPCLVSTVRSTFLDSFESAVQIFENVRGVSPSIDEMGLVLKERAASVSSSMC